MTKEKLQARLRTLKARRAELDLTIQDVEKSIAAPPAAVKKRPKPKAPSKKKPPLKTKPARP